MPGTLSEIAQELVSKTQQVANLRRELAQAEQELATKRAELQAALGNLNKQLKDIFDATGSDREPVQGEE